jgi:hypothetical protein
MLTKRNDGELPVPLEGLAEERITRARAIKFAGATITAGALAFLLPDEADALTRKQRRRRRRRRRAAARRRRQNNVTSDSSTVTFGDTVLNTPSPAENVTITNDGTTPVTLRPEVVGDGFTVAPTFPGIDGFALAPGASIDVPVIFTPDVSGPSTGELRIVDAADGLLVETVELVGEGIL